MFELLAQESGGGSLVAFLPLLLMGVIFYFLLIRPQQRRARAQRELLSSVEVGDEVVTTAGIFGTVIEIDEEDDILTVEIAPGTRVRMMRAGIGRIVVDEATEGEAPDGQDGPFQQT
ncbi:MAG TPA: preprotein translocase subunit YajC [Actinomycetota bacterium]|jgi:preprotein translocase subunit YajC|nr:preprotein translocase subunit YajC [Actinomycetota bacterium]